MMRAFVLALFGCAFLLRVAIPAGWMPVVDAAGVHLAMCTGTGPMAGPDRAAMDATMAHADHKMPSGQDHHPGGDHPCPFAGFALSLAAAPPPVPDLPAAAIASPAASFTVAVAVGRGLAAPPPPATGPPLPA